MTENFLISYFPIIRSLKFLPFEYGVQKDKNPIPIYRLMFNYPFFRTIEAEMIRNIMKENFGVFYKQTSIKFLLLLKKLFYSDQNISHMLLFKLNKENTYVPENIL